MQSIVVENVLLCVCLFVCLFVRSHISLECHFLLVIEVRPTALYERYRLFHIVDPNLNPKFDLDP